MRHHLATFLSIALLQACTPSPVGTAMKAPQLQVRPGLQQLFAPCQCSGTIALFDGQSQTWYTSDSIGLHTYSLPASTFKIFNLLTALQTQTLASPQDTLHWTGQPDTLRYGYRPDIYRDLTAAQAFEQSAVWAFRALSDAIGREAYRQYLSQADYSNLQLTQPDTDFWNFGPFGVTPAQQVQLMRQLFANQLPFDTAYQEMVRRVMLTPTTAPFPIHAKTGWTSQDSLRVGWWVGYALPEEHAPIFFATRLFKSKALDTEDFAECRKTVTLEALQWLMQYRQ